jgi:hypothetical protein
MIKRNPSFELKKYLSSNWANDDAFLTSVFNALSISFPIGEKFFMNSVRAFKDDVSKEISEDIRIFCIQEATHTREHIKYNKLLCELKGYDLEKLEGIFSKKLEKSYTDKVDNKIRLAITTAMEHITASMGASILKGKLIKSDNPVVDMWKWHSLEEVEHKAVAYDVYKAVNGSNKIMRIVMKLALIDMLHANTRVAINMLRHDKQFWKLSTFKSMLRFFFLKSGALRSNYADYKSFFDVDFDPKAHGSDLDLTPWKEKFDTNQFV